MYHVLNTKETCTDGGQTLEDYKTEQRNKICTAWALSSCIPCSRRHFVKLSSLTPVSTGFYRVLFSLPLLLPLAFRGLRILTKKDVLILFLAGVFLAGDVALWNLSFSYTSVANANLLTNLTPFTVIPVSYFLFREKIPKLFLAGAAVTLIGVFVLLGGKISPLRSNYFGDFLAFSASFFYAVFILISYRLRDRYESSVIMFVSGFGSALALGGHLSFNRGHPDSPWDRAALAAIGTDPLPSGHRT